MSKIAIYSLLPKKRTRYSLKADAKVENNSKPNKYLNKEKKEKKQVVCKSLKSNHIEHSKKRHH